MTLPISRRWPLFVALLLPLLPSTPSAAKDFDGRWSVSFMADDASCPTSTIPVMVTDGTISFSSFGATGSGRVRDNGAIDLKIALDETVVRVNGRATGREASGSWRTAPDGCGGRWSAQISN